MTNFLFIYLVLYYNQDFFQFFIILIIKIKIHFGIQSLTKYISILVLFTSQKDTFYFIHFPLVTLFILRLTLDSYEVVKNNIGNSSTHYVISPMVIPYKIIISRILTLITIRIENISSTISGCPFIYTPTSFSSFPL